MSLIKCPECNHEVSSKASSCPNCGVAIAGNVKRCPVCNGFVLMAAAECPHCHTRFAVPAAKPENTSEEAATPPAKPEPVGPVQQELPQKEASQQEVAQPDAPTQEPAPKPAPKSSGSLPWYILLVVTLAIAVGGFLYWEHKNQEASEEKAFMMLEGCTNQLNYEDFIAHYPKSRHLDEVKARLHALERVDSLWGAICAQPTTEALQRFLDENPTSPHQKAALQKIDSIEWYAANRQGTVAAYDAYIARHDNGDYISQAYTARESARQREARALQDSIAAADSLQAAQSVPKRK